MKAPSALESGPFVPLTDIVLGNAEKDIDAGGLTGPAQSRATFHAKLRTQWHTTGN